MANTVTVRFHGVGKPYLYDAGSLSLQTGDVVIVERESGQEIGRVSEHAQPKTDDSPLPHVLRKATREDQLRYEENLEREDEGYVVCKARIEAHGLEMKLVDVECAFDRSRLIFYFTADGRVDFRALVRDLAQAFHMRIELRQIGGRDEARMVGAMGRCGRPLCCATFLSDFVPVTIKMAKDQGLSINPQKISGCCGRLMCCLKYEQETYEEAAKRLPKAGSIQSLPGGKARVESVNPLAERFTYRLLEEGRDAQTMTLEEYQAWKQNRSQRHKPATHSLPAFEDGDLDEALASPPLTKSDLTPTAPMASEAQPEAVPSKPERNRPCACAHGGEEASACKACPSKQQAQLEASTQGPLSPRGEALEAAYQAGELPEWLDAEVFIEEDLPTREPSRNARRPSRRRRPRRPSGESNP